MNNKKILLFGKEIYLLFLKYLEKILPVESDEKFLYENKNFIISSKNQNHAFDLFSFERDSLFRLIKDDFEFDMNSFLDFFFKEIPKVKEINFFLEKFDIDFSLLKEKLEIEKIIEDNKTKSILFIWEKICTQISIFFSFFLSKSEQNLSISSFSNLLEFNIDNFMINFKKEFDLIFLRWLDNIFTNINFAISRFDLLKKPIELFMKKNSEIEVNEKDQIAFNWNNNNKNFNAKDIDNLYLKVEKYQLLKDLFFSKFKEYDFSYSLAEVNLFPNLITNRISDFIEDKTNLFANFNHFNKTKNFEKTKIIYKNNIDLIEYYPNLNEIDILININFDFSLLNKIFLNPTLKEINFFLINKKNHGESFSEKIQIFLKNNKNFSGKVNVFDALDLFSEISSEFINNLKKLNEFKYEILWKSPKKISNFLVFPIKSLIETNKISLSEIGGYVSSPFNLSQLGKSWITKDSFALGDSRVINNAIVENYTILKNNVLISGNSKIKNASISGNVIIKENVMIDNALLRGNVLVGNHTQINGFKEQIPEIKGNVKIFLDKGMIKGKVIIKDNVVLMGTINLESIGDVSKEEIIIQDNAFLKGNVTIKDSVKIKDNAQIIGNNILILNYSEISGNSYLQGNINIFHHTKIYDNAEIGTPTSNILISGNSKIFENAKITNDAQIMNDSQIFGNIIIQAKFKSSLNSKLFANILLNNLENVIFKFSGETLGNGWIKTFTFHDQYNQLIKAIEVKDKAKSNPKYRITAKSKSIWSQKTNKSITVFRIQANQNFGDVSKGDYGGYVESSINLDANSKAWIYDNAIVYGNAVVRDSSRIYDNVVVYENAKISQGAFIFDNVKICGSSRISGKSVISGNVMVEGNVIISAKALIKGNVTLTGNSLIYDDVNISGFSKIINSRIHGNSLISDFAKIKNTNINNSIIKDQSKLYDCDVFNSHFSSSVFLLDTFITNSSVSGSVSGLNSKIIDSIVSNEAIIDKSLIIKSVISEKAKIIDSIIKYSQISNMSFIDWSCVIFSEITEMSKIKNSLIENSYTNFYSSIDHSIIKLSSLDGVIHIKNSMIIFSLLKNKINLNESKIINTKIIENLNIKNSIIKNSTYDLEFETQIKTIINENIENNKNI